jgi:hypothetical protein
MAIAVIVTVRLGIPRVRARSRLSGVPRMARPRRVLAMNHPSAVRQTRASPSATSRRSWMLTPPMTMCGLARLYAGTRGVTPNQEVALCWNTTDRPSVRTRPISCARALFAIRAKIVTLISAPNTPRTIATVGSASQKLKCSVLVRYQAT